MAKKQWFLLAALILLAAVYIYAFTDWGRGSTIQICHAVYSAKPKKILKEHVKSGVVKPNKPATVRFDLDHSYPLTEVIVVSLAGWQTNKSTLPLWHLVSVSNSVPTKRFYYGMSIRGMKPVISHALAIPLETNVIYRLFLTAGSITGQHDFSLPPMQNNLGF